MHGGQLRGACFAASAAIEALLKRGTVLAANGGAARLVLDSGGDSPFAPAIAAALTPAWATVASAPAKAFAAGAPARAAPVAATAAAAASLPGSVPGLGSLGPVLELSSDGRPLVCVSVQLRTGLLLLRAGDGAGAASSGQEMSALLRQARCLALSENGHTNTWEKRQHGQQSLD